MGKLPPGIRKKGRNYYGSWYDAGGVRRYQRLGPDLREAKVLLAEHRRNARRVHAGLADEVQQATSLQELLDAYMEHLRRRRSSKHVGDVEQGLRLLTAGLRRAADLTTSKAQDLQLELSRERAPRTVNKLIGYLTTFLRWCERSGRLARNPVPWVEKLPDRGRHQTKRRRVLTPEEAGQLQRAADRRCIGDLVAIVLGTGFRLGQALAATWGDYSGTHLHAAATKRGRACNNPLPRPVADRLRSIRVARRLPPPEDLIVLDARGRCISQRRAWGNLVRAVEEAGIARVANDGSTVDWHALRHTYATWLAASGIAPQKLQKLLGHRTLAVTMGVYVNLDCIDTDGVEQLLPDLTGPVRGQREA